MELKLELSQKAFNNVSQFKEHCTPSQFETISKVIEQFDDWLNGSGFEAMAAKMKLKAISELDLPNFIASLSYLTNI